MSKKDRLRKEAEKQLAQKKREELEEKKVKESFSESKNVKKYKKQKGKVSEPAYYLPLKLLMLIPFGYSVFFWGGVLVIAILGGMVNEFSFSELSEATAVWIIASAAVMVGAMVLEFFRKYAAGFVLALAGTIMYFHGVNQYIKPITKYLSEKAVKEELLDMDKKWMYRCYPAAAFALIAFVILLIKLITVYVHYKREKEKRDNAPVKSIVSD